MNPSKAPDPKPNTSLLSAIVAPGDVFQQSPLSKTVAPPSSVTSPPAFAPEGVISKTAAVTTVGKLNSCGAG